LSVFHNNASCEKVATRFKADCGNIQGIIMRKIIRKRNYHQK